MFTNLKEADMVVDTVDLELVLLSAWDTRITFTIKYMR